MLLKESPDSQFVCVLLASRKAKSLQNALGKFVDAFFHPNTKYRNSTAFMNGTMAKCDLIKKYFNFIPDYLEE